MTVEVIHDQFLVSHLLTFYDGSIIKDKEFRHLSEPGAEIVLLKALMSRYRIRVTPEARRLLIEDARRWALSEPLERRSVGTQVYQYLTATAGLAVV